MVTILFYSDFMVYMYFTQDYITSSDPGDKKLLISKQAEWAQSSNEPRVAAEMYIAAGEHMKAIELIAEHKWSDM